MMMKREAMVTHETLTTILHAAELAGYQAPPNNPIHLRVWPAGMDTHVPEALPSGYSAVYVFSMAEQTLKVGHCGANSNACYQSRHYGFKHSSTLAKSVFSDPTLAVGVPQDQIGEWIKTNTTRYNILIPAVYGNYFRHFVEKFLALKLGPRYEDRGN